MIFIANEKLSKNQKDEASISKAERVTGVLVNQAKAKSQLLLYNYHKCSTFEITLLEIIQIGIATLEIALFILVHFKSTSYQITSIVNISFEVTSLKT